MNMQAIMKQAKSLQKEMEKAKEDIDQTEFVGENSLVKVTMKGTHETIKVEIINKENMEADDLEMLEDMIQLAINDANKKIEEYTEKKMGKFSSSMPGLF